MKFIASPNFNKRAEGTSLDYIVLHYTAMEPAQEAIDRLCDPQHEVSAHYIIDKDGIITQLVDEDLRAWHAGVSLWKKQEDINSRSLGIELVNRGDESFPQIQIDALKILLKKSVERHNLKRHCLLAHSDIAPTRKKDPGIFFPWQELANEGFGFFPCPEEQDYITAKEDEVQFLLQQIGYDITNQNAALTAFQRRYFPEKIDGQEDEETLARLRCLVRLL